MLLLLRCRSMRYTGAHGFVIILHLLHSLWCRFYSKYENISWSILSPSFECLGVVVSCLAVPWPTPPSIFYLFCYSVLRQDIPYVRFAF